MEFLYLYISIIFNGIYWNLLEFNGIYWNLMEFIIFNGILECCNVGEFQMKTGLFRNHTGLFRNLRSV